MNPIREDDRQDQTRCDKKPYARPELTCHGKVEAVTLQSIPSTSQPID